MGRAQRHIQRANEKGFQISPCPEGKDDWRVRPLAKVILRVYPQTRYQAREARAVH